MSPWGVAKARRVFAALVRLGWSVKRESGSHRTLAPPPRPQHMCYPLDRGRTRKGPSDDYKAAL